MIYSSHTDYALNSQYNKNESFYNTNSSLFDTHQTKSIPECGYSSITSRKSATIQPQMNAKLELLTSITKQHFPNIDFQQNQLLYSTLEVFSQFSGFMIAGSGFTLLIKPERKLAISDNFDAFLNLYAQPDFHLAQMTSIHTLSDAEFDAINQRIAESSKVKMIGLNSLLWQIYSKILPFGFDADTNHLDMKVKYMPNFSIMAGTPVLYKNILASCLLQAKNIQQLEQLFPDVSIQELDRLFLIAIYSEVIDLNALQLSHKNSMVAENCHTHEKSIVSQAKEISATIPQNKGIQKAKKTNFLTRILQKLSS